MKKSKGALESRNRGFTMLELLVAVAVTAILATMLLTITRQVVVTHGQTSGNLETNQIANFVLDRIQEDLHCALYRNDGGAWMVATISEDTSTSDSWKQASTPKPPDESIR
ncbi:MAG: prepilin-type N-terminal cleavage/methylation domain-containing protein, partial [Opitutae bacterium]|nr:prepilin-type N-terminal cleavage/methylation domain-containing protein [Opitutae bacterium]